MGKRIFDFIFASFGLVLFSPVFLVVAIANKLQDGQEIFFIQRRVGYRGQTFLMFKFRSMTSASSGPLFTTATDKRITAVGKVIRRYKIDELPQLINVVRGEMSFVGPRPEVEEFVNYYDEEQRRVLNFKPGITDPASIRFRHEGEILEKTDSPEEYYISTIMPEKIRINLEYQQRANLLTDVKIICETAWVSFFAR